MDSALDPSPEDLLELDIDVRLHSVLLWALAEDDLNDEMLGGFLRVAYAVGYQDALSESVRGELFRDHGYRPPSKRPRPPAEGDV